MDIDEKYLMTVDQFASNHYNWVQQYIQIDCLSTDLDLIVPGSTLTRKGLENAFYLVHEYIHYLQNFATVWGGALCTDLVLAYLMIGASSANEKDTYRPPLDVSLVTNQDLAKGLTRVAEVRDRLRTGDKTRQIPAGTRQPFTSSSAGGIVTICNGIIEVQVGLWVIRESMAHMGSLLFQGKSDPEIHAFNESISRLAAAMPPFSAKAEYWIVFEYFYELNCYYDVARGVFYLMQYALCTKNPEKTIYRFFEFLTSTMPSQSLEADVQLFYQSARELQLRTTDYQKMMQRTRNVLEVCRKHQNDHHLYLFVGKMVEYMLENITSNQGGQIFATNARFHNFDFWRALMVKYGTGIIKFIGGAATMSGTRAHIDNMREPFLTLLAVGSVLEKLERDDILGCPFLHEFNICGAPFRDSPGCLRNPFLVTNPAVGGEECQFRNGYLLLGMEDRITFPS